MQSGIYSEADTAERNNLSVIFFNATKDSQQRRYSIQLNGYNVIITL
jgi:hypothetical protein